MQFQVPQFIEVEDTIVGPLTLRQFAYVAVAGGISIFLYFSVEPWLWVGLSVFFLGIAAALAFVKVNGRPLPTVLIAAVRFYWKPQTYAWKKEHRRVPEAPSSGFSLRTIAEGFALKNAWRSLQTGIPSKKPVFKKSKERYEIFRKITGDKRAARRIDYR